jgi:hypothetical protein
LPLGARLFPEAARLLSRRLAAQDWRARLPPKAEVSLKKSRPMRRLFVALVLAAAGAIVFSQGLYIHAKAMLAQVLLQRAFVESLATGIPGPRRASR